MTEDKNFTNQATPSIIDTEYRGCNFTQRVPLDVAGLKRGVRLFPGDDTPRVFIDCNLCNCEPPPGSTVTGGLRVIKEFGVETDTDTITIAGQSIVLQHHADYIHGHWAPGGYDDLPTPVIIPRD